MRILGLDIGTTSIGFALVDFDKSRDAGSILRLGVRIFPEARDPDGTPLNQQRRAKRMMRRQLRRRRERRRSLNELLASSDLLPAYGGNQWRDVMKLDPYALRAKGLSEPLTPHELGRALYHLSKRRHFKERDLVEIGESETVPDNEEAAPAKPRGKAKVAPKDGELNDEAKSTEARKHFVAELNASGTLGQALAARAPDAKRRGEHATRAIVEEEFLRLVAAQAPRHAVLRDAAFHGALDEAVFAQRSVFWRKSTLGKCALMPGEPLCPKGSWLSQERRMLEKVNNLAIVGGNARRLDMEERGAILAALRMQKTLSWPGVRRVLDPASRRAAKARKRCVSIWRRATRRAGSRAISSKPISRRFSARAGIRIRASKNCVISFPRVSGRRIIAKSERSAS